MNGSRSPFFGGAKLGVSGLINAYENTARIALEALPIWEKRLNHYGLKIRTSPTSILAGVRMRHEIARLNDSGRPA